MAHFKNLEKRVSSIEYTIENSPKTADDKVVRDGIVNFNGQLINKEATHFSVFAKDDTQIICGALIWEHSDALYINVLWCRKTWILFHRNHTKIPEGSRSDFHEEN